MKRIITWLILGTKGGHNRAKIIKYLHDNPANANQLANDLNLNYRTITHHLSVLEEMNIIVSVGKKYGRMYMLSDEMDESYDSFEEIWSKLEE